MSEQKQMWKDMVALFIDVFKKGNLSEHKDTLKWVDAFYNTFSSDRYRESYNSVTQKLNLVFNQFIVLSKLRQLHITKSGWEMLILTGTDWSFCPFFPLAFSISSDPDIADQGQILVVVTASVGGFSLLVILTLFLLITGR